MAEQAGVGYNSGMGDAEKKPKPTIGELIRARRLELNLSQSEVARQMGVSQGLVGQWETNRTRVMADDLEKLAEILETTRGYFLGETYFEIASKIMRSVDSMISAMGVPITDDLRRSILVAMYGEMTHEQKNLLMTAAMEIVLKESV